MTARRARFELPPVTCVFILIGVCAGCLALAASQSRADDPKPPASSESKIKDLQKERLAALRDMARLVGERFKNGSGTLEELREANRLVFRAELDLCGSDKERVEVLEKQLAEAKNLERSADQLVKLGGQLRTSSALLAKADRLQAEIDLERAKAKLAAAPPKGNAALEINDEIALAEKRLAIRLAEVQMAEVQKKMALAKLTSAKAQYTQAEAAERYAEAQAKRMDELVAAKAVSAEIVNEQRAKKETATARKAAAAGFVEEAEGQIMLEQARVELAKKKVEEAELRCKLLKQQAGEKP
ncbi:MAG TPA: hypothetical protein VGZ47_08935 [Gemmataceae bacterium]|nr:hypothetical protein [Gemmataceae bacterium]